MLKQEGRIDHQERSVSKKNLFSDKFFICPPIRSVIQMEVEDLHHHLLKHQQDPNSQRKKKTRIKLQAFAEVCDRTGFSDRAASFIASSVPEDAGSTQKEDFNSMKDRNKIRRAKKEFVLSISSMTRLHCYYFYGREDKTKAQEEIDNVKHKRTAIERRTCEFWLKNQNLIMWDILHLL